VALQALRAAAAVVVGSLLLGYALNLLGVRCRAAAPAVGLSLLIVIASIAIKLPGGATTAAVVLLVMVLGAAALAIVSRPRLRFPGASVAVIAIAGFGASIPFLANGRVGLLGVSLDNDTATHLIYAQSLRSSVTRAIYPLPSGYPLGPHSLVDALSTGLGVRLDLAFTALLFATVLITALVAMRAIPGASAWRRVIVGVLSSLLYLVAAYYAEAAFKEQILGVLLLAFVLHLEEVTADWPGDARHRWAALLPAALLVAAGVYVYSYPALVWFGLTVVIWLLAELVTDPSRLRRWRAQWRELGAPIGAGVALLALVLAPIAGRIVSLFGTFGVSPASTGAITASNLGNLPHALSPYEALGIWNSADFRYVPVNVFHAGELAGLALGVLILGLVWSLARRELLLPAAVLACAIVYWRATKGQSPYVSAKALVIAGPVVAVTGLRGLLRSVQSSVPWWVRAARLALAAAFVSFAAYSSYQALRNGPVWPEESTSELLALDKLTRGKELLFLGNSDYAEWLFQDSRMSALGITINSLDQAVPRGGVPVSYGTALDFDSVEPPSLNRFSWVITSKSPYASQVPPSFRLVRQLRMYELWERVSTVSVRQTIAPLGAPGAVLNCATRDGRALSRSGGVADLMVQPIVVPLSTLPPGGEQRVSLSLPPGLWELSLQYVSADPLELLAQGEHWTMPAYLDRPGPWFAVGRIYSTGVPITVTVRANRPSSFTGPNLNALTAGLAATSVPDLRKLVPLRRACGRYIDWYRA